MCYCLCTSIFLSTDFSLHGVHGCTVEYRTCKTAYSRTRFKIRSKDNAIYLYRNGDFNMTDLNFNKLVLMSLSKTV